MRNALAATATATASAIVSIALFTGLSAAFPNSPVAVPFTPVALSSPDAGPSAPAGCVSDDRGPGTDRTVVDCSHRAARIAYTRECVTDALSMIKKHQIPGLTPREARATCAREAVLHAR